MLSHIAPERVKFGDEKSLKGQELYNRDVRRNPITNEVPATTLTRILEIHIPSLGSVALTEEQTPFGTVYTEEQTMQNNSNVILRLQ